MSLKTNIDYLNKIHVVIFCFCVYRVPLYKVVDKVWWYVMHIVSLNQTLV